MRALRLLLLAVAAFGLWTFFNSKGGVRAGGLALDSAEAQAACSVSKFPEPEFFERAKAAGVTAVLLRPQSLAAAVQRGGLLHFTRADIDKMRQLGLVHSRSPLRADSVWSRDKGAVALLERMLKRRGLPVTETEMSGMRGLLFAEGAQPQSLTLGYDRRTLEEIRAQGLTPVFFVEDDADIEAAAAAPGPVVLVSQAFHGPLSVPALAEATARGGWVAFANAGKEGSLAPLDKAARLRWIEEAPLAPGQILLMGEVGVLEGEEGLRRELSRGNELILERLNPARGVEWNFDRLRSEAASMRSDFPAGIPASAPGRSALPASYRIALFSLAAVLAGFGAVLGMRKGLDAVRSASFWMRFPQASPLFETSCGLFTAAGVCALAGLCAHAALCVREWRLGVFPAGLEAAVFLLTGAVGAAALYPLDPRRWARGSAAGQGRSAGASDPPGGYADEAPMEGLCTRPLLVRAARVGLFLAAAALVASPVWTRGSALDSWAAALGLQARGPWTSARYAEAALGQAAIFVAFWTYGARVRARPVRSPKGSSGERELRPWLLLGLLGLAGGILSFTGAAPGQAVRRLLAGVLLGMPLGLLIVALGAYRGKSD